MCVYLSSSLRRYSPGTERVNQNLVAFLECRQGSLDSHSLTRWELLFRVAVSSCCSIAGWKAVTLDCLRNGILRRQNNDGRHFHVLRTKRASTFGYVLLGGVGALDSQECRKRFIG